MIKLDDKYTPLFLIGTLLMAISFGIQDTWPWGSDGLSNIGTGFYGSIVVYYLVEKSLEESQKREATRRRKIALTRVRIPLQRLLAFLVQLYKASSVQPDPMPTSYEELFTDDYFDNIRYLDFEQDAPISPKRSWMIYSSETVIRLKQQFDQIIDTYGLMLEPETLQMLENVSNCKIIGYCRELPAIIQVDKQTGFKRAYLMLNGTHSLLEQDIPIIMSLLGEVNAVVDHPLELTPDFGKNNVAPKWGINRTKLIIK